MAQEFFQIDAFTHHPFAGNPAAVMLLDEEKSDEWLAHVAAENNLSETSFLWKTPEGFKLRWFTPTVEVDICGHGTLAGAHFLWEKGFLPKNEEAVFHTRSGELRARRRGDEIEMDFPAHPPEKRDPPDGLDQILGENCIWYGASANGVFGVALFDSEEKVRKMKPRFEEMRDLPTRSILATAKGESKDYDFVSRVFGPVFGVNEDPATGSAHCCLGPFWAKRLEKNDLSAFQASSRGAEIGVGITEKGVNLRGRAVTVIKGELLV